LQGVDVPFEMGRQNNIPLHERMGCKIIALQVNVVNIRRLIKKLLA
jgi:hypothetical protein